MGKLSSLVNSVRCGWALRNAPRGLFLHIQKTAGTSIIQIAQQHYRISMCSHGDHVDKKPGDLQKLKFVSGHFGFDFASRLMDGRYSFTFLRDPQKRIQSMYYFLRGQEKNLFPMYKVAKDLKFEEFLRAGFSDPMVKKRIWNNQVWQLAHGWANLDGRNIEDFEPERLLDLAMEHLDRFSHVGFTETFERDRDIILNGLGLPLPEERVVANVSKKPKSPLSDEIREMLTELTQLDQCLYDYAWNRFNT